MTLNDHYGFLRDTNASALQQKNWESDGNVNRWSIAMNKLINCLLRRGVLLLVLASTLFSGSMAFAQNAANGKILYCAPVVTGVVKCADGACHGPSVATNNNKIKNGANNPATSTGKGISFAIGSVSEMRALSPLSTTQLNDLGAFIAAPSVCTTAAAPGASIAPAALTFASTTVGSTAAMQVATLTNSGTAALSITSTAISGTDFTISANTCTAGASIAAGGALSLRHLPRQPPGQERVPSLSLTMPHQPRVRSRFLVLASRSLSAPPPQHCQPPYSRSRPRTLALHPPRNQ